MKEISVHKENFSLYLAVIVSYLPVVVATYKLKVSISTVHGPFANYNVSCNSNNPTISLFTTSGHQEIQKAMQDSGTIKAWLPVQRRNLAKWTWLSGNIYNGTMSDPNKGRNKCAVLWREAGIIEPDECNRTYHQYMCESGNPCSTLNGYSEERLLHCFEVKNMTYVIYESEKTWFQAKQSCYQKNAKLASFESNNEKTIKNKVKTLSESTGKLLIGLRIMDYIYRLPGTAEKDCNYFMWADREPCVCPEKECVTVVKNSEGQVSWIQEKCTANHKFICGVLSGEGENVTATAEDPTGLPGATVALILVSCALFVTLVFGIFFICKWRREQSRQNQNDCNELNPLLSKEELSEEANYILNDILRAHLPWKKDINIVMVGLPGTGKSSLINSLITALTPGGYQPVARPGNFGGAGQPITWFIERFPLSGEMQEKPEFEYQPVFWDCPGFTDDSGERTVNLLRFIIAGKLPLRTVIPDVLHTAEFELSSSNDQNEQTCSQMDLIIFVHECGSPVPEQLADALVKATRFPDTYNARMILVINKRDKLENDEGKLHDVTDEMSKVLGLQNEVERISCLSCYFSKDNFATSTIQRSTEIDDYMCQLWRKLLKVLRVQR